MKKLFLFILVIVATFGLTACAVGGRVPREVELDYIQTQSGSSLTQTTEITDNEYRWNFVSVYDIGRYAFDKWRVTDSKIVHIVAKAEEIPEGTEVLVEHVHADISVKTTSEGTNGFLQDSMDDYYHGYSQDGFSISSYPYEEVFAIEGYNETFISGYVNAFYGSVSEDRLTESDIIRSGAYAQQLTVVYNLLVKYPGEKMYHTVTVLDEVLIPIKNGDEETELDEVQNGDEETE